MLGRLYENQDCAAARALELVGERWSLLILRDSLFAGCTRFSEFQRRLGIAPNILAKRLESFVAAGIMEVRPSTNGSEHATYVLTPKGLDFKPVVIALTQWGEKWSTPGPVDFVHAGCGGLVEQRSHCAACGVNPTVADVHVRLRNARPRDPDQRRAVKKQPRG
jgi:DNA-binding HxlR family transcriptional regulator